MDEAPLIPPQDGELKFEHGRWIGKRANGDTIWMLDSTFQKYVDRYLAIRKSPGTHENLQRARIILQRLTYWNAIQDDPEIHCIPIGKRALEAR